MLAVLARPVPDLRCPGPFETLLWTKLSVYALSDSRRQKKLLSVPKFGGIRDEITITEIMGTCHHVELSLASKPNQHQQFSLKKKVSKSYKGNL